MGNCPVKKRPFSSSRRNKVVVVDPSSSSKDQSIRNNNNENVVVKPVSPNNNVSSKVDNTILYCEETADTTTTTTTDDENDAESTIFSILSSNSMTLSTEGFSKWNTCKKKGGWGGEESDTSTESDDEKGGSTMTTTFAAPSCFTRSLTPTIPEDASSIPEESELIDRQVTTIEEEEEEEEEEEYDGAAGATMVTSTGGGCSSSSSIGDCNSVVSFSSMSSCSSQSSFRKRHHRKKTTSSSSMRRRMRSSSSSSSRRQQHYSKSKNLDNAAVNSSVICDFLELQKLIQKQKKLMQTKQTIRNQREMELYEEMLQSLHSIQNDVQQDEKASSMQIRGLPFFSDNSCWFVDFFKMDGGTAQDETTTTNGLFPFGQTNERTTTRETSSSLSLADDNQSHCTSDCDSVLSMNYSVSRRRRRRQQCSYADSQDEEDDDQVDSSKQTIASMLTPHHNAYQCTSSDLSVVDAIHDDDHSCISLPRRPSLSQSILSCENKLKSIGVVDDDDDQRPSSKRTSSKQQQPPVIDINESIKRITESPCKHVHKTLDRMGKNVIITQEPNNNSNTRTKRISSSSTAIINNNNATTQLKLIQSFINHDDNDEETLSNQCYSEQSPSSVLDLPHIIEDIHLIKTPKHANVRTTTMNRIKHHHHVSSSSKRDAMKG